MKNLHKSTKNSINTIWICGKHSVKAALLNSKRQCYNLLATSNSIKELIGLYENHKNLRISIVDSKIIADKFAKNTVHQNFALEVAPMQAIDLNDIIENPGQNSCIIALDQITDPHNIGAIIRSAAAFSATCVLATINNAPGETSTIAKSASGALEIVPFIKITNLVSSLKDLKNAGYWIIGLDGEAKETLHQMKLEGKIVFVMGAEGSGMRRLTRQTCDFMARLPINGAVESLNVSNASAITLYEYFRQNS
jgi:23S rRNA (guanosine2251-2'-O)-methyltransferase